MKMTYIITGLLIVGIIFFITSCNKKLKDNQQTKDTTKRENVDPNNNPYNDLRNKALNATEEQIGVELPKEETKIYGVIMDWDVGNGTATLVSFISGDASLYLSSGGGMIGGGTNENVKNASVNFLKSAEKYLDKTTKTKTNTLPKKDGVNFYLLTNKGKFFGEEELKNIENNSSEWLELFNEGNKLITEIRIVSENK